MSRLQIAVNGEPASLVDLFRMASAGRAPWTCPTCGEDNRGKDLRCGGPGPDGCGARRPE